MENHQIEDNRDMRPEFDGKPCVRCGAADPKDCQCSPDDCWPDPMPKLTAESEAASAARTAERRNGNGGMTEHATGSKADDWQDRTEEE